MGFKMVIVPPNTQPDWPEKIRAVVPDCDVQMFNSAEAALDAIVEADAAYGNIGPELLQRARKCRTELLLENCQRFNAGRPLHNVVDKANWF